jgi:hypothetical protein
MTEYFDGNRLIFMAFWLICNCFETKHVRILKQPLSHFFRESTFDILILRGFHFGMKSVKHSLEHSLTCTFK